MGHAGHADASPPRHRLILSTKSLPLFNPVRTASGFLDTFVQAAGVDEEAAVSGLTAAEAVPIPDLHGIDAQVAGDSVEMAFKGKGHLGAAKTSKGGAGLVIRVDAVAIVTPVRTLYKAEKARPAQLSVEGPRSLYAPLSI